MTDDDDDFLDALDIDDDVPRFGTCCVCGGTDHVRNIIMLDLRSPTPGRGWGCVVCNLPLDGAYAVVCDPCMEFCVADLDVLKFACKGYPAEDGRVPIADLTEPFGHDEGVDHDG